MADDRRNPQPARSTGSLSLAPSYAVLCAAQAALVLATRPPRSRGRAGIAGVVVPAAALALADVVIRVVAGGPHDLALLGAVGTPLLAATGPRRMPLAAGLWLLAWLAHGLVAQATGVTLICLAAAAAARLVARFAPDGPIALGLVVVAIVDVVLVWGTPQVQPASTALHHAALPAAAGRTIPRLQDATFGSATMGWLDLFAPALLGVVVARARLRAAVATVAGAGAWGLLLAITTTVPATVPVLAGLVATGRYRQIAPIRSRWPSGRGSASPRA